MSQRDLDRARALAQAATVLSPAERNSFLDRECAHDGSLRREVETIISSNRGSVMDDDPPTVVSSEGTGKPPAIDGFEIGARIGEGAFGVVYEARQVSPVERQVALKVLRPGMDSEEIEARFRRERQALAVMDHPGIAKIHDAGRTADGRPWFVMDLVDGEPIVAHCEGRRLGVRARLELFARVCRAIQHAHSKGVIHRDLKPTNILVTSRDGEDLPVVIDFGVAKVTGGADWTRSFVTIDAALIGTPAYMSPEQVAGGQDVDTRADIYSLGAVLYEMLTSCRILDDGRDAKRELHDVLERVLEHEPVRPSRRIEQARAARPASEGPVDGTIRAAALEGDLDWVVMKALSKDRERRYATAEAFAEDVERYLDSRPVRARPPSALYLSARFMRRHRIECIALLVVLLVLIGGIVGTTRGLIEAKKARESESKQRTIAQSERDEARRAYAVSDAVNAFMNDDILGASAPDALGFDVSVRTALELAAARLESRPIEPKEVELALKLTIGRTFVHSGLVERGAPLVEKAFEEALRILPSGSHLLADVRFELAETRQRQTRYQEALDLYEASIAERSARSGANHVDSLFSEYGIVACLSELGRNDEAERRLVSLESRCREHLGPDHRLSLLSKRGLGLIANESGRVDEARAIFAEVLDRALTSLGERDVLVFQLLINLGDVDVRANRLDAAEATFNRGAEIRRRAFGPDHPLTLLHEMRIAQIASRRGDHGSAIAKMATVDEGLTKAVGEAHSLTLEARMVRAQILVASGNVEEARRVALGLIESKGTGPAIDAVRARARHLLEHTQAASLPTERP